MPQNNPMTELLDFIKSSNITPQQAQEKVQSLISSGQMSQQQFETLKQQAMNIAAVGSAGGSGNANGGVQPRIYINIPAGAKIKAIYINKG